MNTSRRGFLKMLGIALGAVAAAPLLKRVPEPKRTVLTGYRKFDPIDYHGELTWKNLNDTYQRLYEARPQGELALICSPETKAKIMRALEAPRPFEAEQLSQSMAGLGLHVGNPMDMAAYAVLMRPGEFKL